MNANLVSIMKNDPASIHKCILSYSDRICRLELIDFKSKNVNSQCINFASTRDINLPARCR
jgi:hypothetical protein